MFASHGGVGAAAGVCPTKVFMGGIKAGVTPTEQTQLWKSSVCTLWAHRNSRIKISFKEEQHDDCSGIGFV
nr:MAG TPA: hypothetical protein [Caudoviricetes sp.]